MKPTTHLKLLPFVFYEDPAAALGWLGKAFGFHERFRLSMPNGKVAHAELELGDGVVMIGNVGSRNREGHEWYFAQHVRDVSVAELSRR